MRKLLLSTVSVAALVALAACSDETAENRNDNPAAVEQSAEVDTAIPTTGQTADASGETDTQMQADAQPGAGTEPGVVITEEADTTASAEAELPADIEKAQQAIDDARTAIQVESEAEAIQALQNVESALGTAGETADARQAIEDARDAVVSGEFDVALTALDEAEAAIEATGRASADMPTSDETTSSTSE
jgi:hypothetical protein